MKSILSPSVLNVTKGITKDGKRKRSTSRTNGSMINDGKGGAKISQKVEGLKIELNLDDKGQSIKNTK
jgi:hypothetical protein